MYFYMKYIAKVLGIAAICLAFASIGCNKNKPIEKIDLFNNLTGGHIQYIDKRDSAKAFYYDDWPVDGVLDNFEEWGWLYQTDKTGKTIKKEFCCIRRRRIAESENMARVDNHNDSVFSDLITDDPDHYFKEHYSIARYTPEACSLQDRFDEVRATYNTYNK